MGTIATALLLLICLAAFLYQTAALAASLQFILRRRKAAATSATPAISILKPVKGLDPGFAEAIRSHAEQDYPEFEMLFGFPDANDPAIQEVEKLRAELPQRDIRRVHCQTRLPHPKVSTLVDLEREARHAVLLVNDADVRVGPGYLRTIAGELEDQNAGLVTCLYRVDAATLPARWMALGIATDFAPSTLVARWVGVREFALGSTLLLRREDLKRVGGFESLANHIADDYQLAKRITGLGKRVVLSREVVSTTLQTGSWGGVWRQQVRWQQMIRLSRGGGYAGLPVTFASLWAAVALAAGQTEVAAALLAGRMLAGMVAGIGVLDCPVTWRLWFLVPLRDLWGVAAWTAGLFGRTVRWRDAVIRLGAEGTIESRSGEPGQPG